MTGTTIACISVAGAGLLTALLSLLFFMRAKMLKERCTARAAGTVIGHRFNRTNESGVSFAPVVEFMVNGRIYKARRHYRGLAVKRITGADAQQESFYISEKDVFHLNIAGNAHNYRMMAEEAWPLGSELPVLYDPQKPKRAFVEKVVTASGTVGIVLLCIGAGLILLAGVFFLIFG